MLQIFGDRVFRMQRWRKVSYRQRGKVWNSDPTALFWGAKSEERDEKAENNLRKETGGWESPRKGLWFVYERRNRFRNAILGVTSRLFICSYLIPWTCVDICPHWGERKGARLYLLPPLRVPPCQHCGCPLKLVVSGSDVCVCGVVQDLKWVCSPHCSSEQRTSWPTSPFFPSRDGLVTSLNSFQIILVVTYCWLSSCCMIKQKSLSGFKYYIRDLIKILWSLRQIQNKT